MVLISTKGVPRGLDGLGGAAQAVIEYVVQPFVLFRICPTAEKYMFYNYLFNNYCDERTTEVFRYGLTLPWELFDIGI